MRLKRTTLTETVSVSNTVITFKYIAILLTSLTPSPKVQIRAKQTRLNLDSGLSLKSHEYYGRYLGVAFMSCLFLY